MMRYKTIKVKCGFGHIKMKVKRKDITKLRTELREIARLTAKHVKKDLFDRAAELVVTGSTTIELPDMEKTK